MMKEWITGTLINESDSYYFNSRSKKYDLPVSDTIFTFDIETSSLFNIDGEWKRFNYDLSPEYYQEVRKCAVPYIWMFGDESEVYYGRELWDFEEVLKSISSPDCYKVIWVQNLSFEFTFLMNIFYKKYTLVDVIAREIKKPIEFRVKELNIIFRCSYMLTNLSLEKAAKEYTNVEKRSGDLDYNVERSPLTPLTDTELGYCEYDIITLREIIRYHLKEYGHIAKIPLTSTGIVRKALKDKMGFWYIRDMQKLVPTSKIYLLLMQAFSGGYTHANCLHSGTYFKEDIESMDLASSYPAVLCTELYPCSDFIKCSPVQYKNKHKRATYAFLFKVRFKGVKSRFYNHYMQGSKCLFYDSAGNSYDYNRAIRNRKELGLVLDNGRVVSCNDAMMVLCDNDLEMIKRNYNIDKIEYLECYKAKKDYLDENVIKFILELYGNKTSLKGVEDMEAIYKRDKGRLNGIFGMAVTNQLKNSCEFKDDIWSHKPFSKSFIEGKLEEMKKSSSTLFMYSTGVWCTSYARRNLVDKIVLSSHSMDKDVIYCDTDSCKFRNREKHLDIFLSYNLEMIEKYRAVCERYPDLELKSFMPADKKGVLHPIGFYEFDGAYSEFITLGAKKYCYREDGELHITVSGVSKNGVVALEDDIHNFKKRFTWNYCTSGKKTHYYREMHLVNGVLVDDLQPDITFKDYLGKEYKSKYKWSIILMPTTYTLGITDIYEALIKQIKEKETCK